MTKAKSWFNYVLAVELLNFSVPQVFFFFIGNKEPLPPSRVSKDIFIFSLHFGQGQPSQAVTAILVDWETVHAVIWT